MSDFSSPFLPIDYGRDFNFYTKRTVSNTNYTTNCHEVIRFPTFSVTFHLETGTRVEYSFNGSTTHGDMTSGKASATLTFENRVISKIWFRGDGYVRIEAWGIR